MHDLVQFQVKKDSKKGKCMHSLSVSVCPCLSETECAHAFCMGICGCIIRTCCYVLTRLRTASSLSFLLEILVLHCMTCWCCSLRHTHLGISSNKIWTCQGLHYSCSIGYTSWPYMLADDSVTIIIQCSLHFKVF